jgi:hypothetical protein
MKISAERLYEKLVSGYGIIGQTGVITFTLKGFSMNRIKRFSWKFDSRMATELDASARN